MTRGTCSRCRRPADAEREVCAPCAGAIRDEVGAGFLQELARYWARRTLEGRKRDWT